MSCTAGASRPTLISLSDRWIGPLKAFIGYSEANNTSFAKVGGALEWPALTSAWEGKGGEWVDRDSAASFNGFALDLRNDSILCIALRSAMPKVYEAASKSLAQVAKSLRYHRANVQHRIDISSPQLCGKSKKPRVIITPIEVTLCRRCSSATRPFPRETQRMYHYRLPPWNRTLVIQDT